ncbi:MAG: TonB-dependent receptor [Acidobacteriia bacterium]|nr:TonB-dependent receptor [Terriglobia bacterium]
MRTLVAIAGAMIFLASFRVSAQDLANIVGTVTDASGAVIPDVNVTVSNPDRGFTRKLISDSAGEYTAARVPIGNYIVTVEKAGFQKLVRSGITAQVGQTLRVDLQLQVGSATQEVVVNANVAKVETETGAISDVVTGSQVSQLNLNARNFANLATLVPGAATLGTGFDTSHVGVLANAAISFNGLPVNIENWEVDSTNNIDQGSGSGSVMTYPSIDSIAEFRVSTANYSAEYGKSGGANIEVVTKSGTKDFHGDLFEFVRNEKFDANDWFANRQITPDGSSAPKTPLKRNNWGFTLGGPVIIPGHYNRDRNKTFFFVSEEWRENREGTVIDQQVPTQRMRNGDFSECDPGSPNYNVVAASGCKLPTNPDTGTLFPNNVVPINSTAKALLDGLVPLPNNGIDRYTAAPSLPTSFREDMFKIDQNITDNIRAFFRYTQDAFESDYIPTLWSYATFGTVKSRWQSPAKSAVFHLTQTIRPDLLNEFIASFSADVNKVNNYTGFDSPAGSINKPSGFDAKTIFPANQDIVKLPSIAIGGGVPFNFGQSTGFEFFFWDPQIAFKDNVVWTKGRHTLKAGFFLLRNNINTTTNIGYNPQGNYTFSDGSSLSTGNALADMFLGRIAGYEEYGRTVNGQLLGGSALGHWRQWDFEPYFQDDWRLTSHLTLNLGVRYYWLSPFYDSMKPTNDSLFIPSQYDPAKEAKLDINGNFIPGTGATPINYGNGLVECGTGSIPKGCYHSFRGTVSPRFGFAWDPFGHATTSIRGGYALTWDGGNPLHNGAGFNGNPPAAADLFSYNIAGFDNVGPGPIPPSGFSNVNVSKWQEIQQFNLGVQHQFPGNNILSVSYVGTLGHHLQQNVNINQVRVGSGMQNVPALAGTPGCDAHGNCDVQNILMNTLQNSVFFVPYPGYASINQRQMTGNSNYNSLQVNFRHTFGYGIAFQAAYTWAHELDNMFQGGSANSGGTNGIDDQNLRRWYGTGGLNQSQMLVMNYVYELPFFKSSQNRLARNVLGGWEISGITSFLAGTPIGVTCGIAGMATGIGGPTGCNSLGPLGVKKGTVNDPQFGPTPTWFDPSLIGNVTVDQLRADNQPGMFGYMGKYALTGPGRNNWDIAVLRNFQAPWFKSEHSSLQFRFESYNTFNHPQWNGVNLFCSDQTAPGAPCNGDNNVGNGQVSGAARPRILQLGLKFVF